MKSLIVSVVLFFGVCLIYILIMLSKTENYFTYIIDDAYIHLSVAKNFALHRVWGMTPYSFSSSSSSPAFTFILSVFIYIFGDNELIPLFFNIACSFFIIFFLTKYYSCFFSEKKSVVATTLFTLFFAVLHLQVVIGMEHVLQSLIVIINVLYFYRWISSGFKDRDSSYWFYFTISLLGLIRFESMFYFAALAFVFFLVKKIKAGFLTLFFGFVPILLFGYFNYQEAGYFFPNSVIVKGTQVDFSGDSLDQIYTILFKNMLFNISFYKVGLLPLLIAIILIYRGFKDKKSFQEIISDNFLVIVWSFTLILHSMFGNLRGFFRYEAYILAGFSMALIPKLKDFFMQPLLAMKKDKIMGALVLSTALVLVYKFGYAHKMIVNGSRNIYEQQVQSARFLNTYYNTSKVVANDIGAVCYFSDIHLLDIAGLGSKEMIPFNEKGRVFGEEFEHFLARYSIENHYQLAMVYEDWFAGHVPKNWRKVAVLKINNNMTVALDRVTIYSIDPAVYDNLKRNVRNFNWNKNIKVEIIE